MQGWIYGMMPSIPVPGNHEYDKADDGSRVFSKHWNQIYTMPENGPSEKFNNRCYYLDYQGVRFISFDSPAMGVNKDDAAQILKWLDSALEKNPNKWAIVFTHYPIFSCSQGRDNDEYRDAVKPILEKHGVDLVLQGHDHTYCRGQNLSQVTDKINNIPMYVVSVAGPKMYGLNTSFWSDRMASNTQLYQHILVEGNTIDYKAYTVDGELYDAFKLVKKKSGRNNVVESNEVNNIKQRSDIPEGAQKKYTEDELKKYKKQFSAQ
jgi:3',5'-cyclic AMP phosphodiesterase CpdA